MFCYCSVATLYWWAFGLIGVGDVSSEWWRNSTCEFKYPSTWNKMYDTKDKNISYFRHYLAFGVCSTCRYIDTNWIFKYNIFVQIIVNCNHTIDNKTKTIFFLKLHPIHQFSCNRTSFFLFHSCRFFFFFSFQMTPMTATISDKSSSFFNFIFLSASTKWHSDVAFLFDFWFTLWPLDYKRNGTDQKWN